MGLALGERVKETLTLIEKVFEEEILQRFKKSKGAQKARQALTLDFNSFSSLLPYRYYDEATHLFVNEKSLGFGLEIPPFAGVDDTTIKGLHEFFLNEVDSTFEIQVALLGTPEIGHLIDSNERLQKKGGPEFSSVATNTAAYLKAGALGRLANNRNLPCSPRNYRAFLFVSRKGSPENPKAVQVLSKLRTSLINNLKTVGLNAIEPLTLNDFINHVWRLIHFNPRRLYAPEREYNLLERLDEQLVERTYALSVEEDALAVQFDDEEKVLAEEDEENEKNKESLKAHLMREMQRPFKKEAVAVTPCEVVVTNLSLAKAPHEFALWMAADNLANVFSPMNALEAPFYWTTTFKVTELYKSQAKATKKHLDFQRKVGTPYSVLFPDTPKKAAEWERVRDGLTQGEFKFVEAFVNVTLFSEPQKAQADLDAAKACFDKNGLQLSAIKYLNLQSALMNLPFMASEGVFEDLKALKRTVTMTSFNCTNLLPLVADYKIGHEGLALLSKRNQLCYYNNFTQENLDNYNVCIAAASGSGKSFLVQGLMLQVLMRQGKVFVIDIGESYKKFSQLVGGTYITYENLRLNPFSTVNDISEDSEKVTSLFALLAETTDSFQIGILRTAVQRAYEAKGKTACIDEVIAALDTLYLEKDKDKRIDDLTMGLSHYKKGASDGQYFNEYSALAPEANLVVLELGGLTDKPKLKQAVLYSLMLAVEAQMYHSPRHLQKLCVIDEAFQFFDGTNTEVARFIAKGFRTARKYNGGFIMISQLLMDFMKSNETQAAWASSASKVIMRQEATDIDNFTAQNPNFFSNYEATLLRRFMPSKANGFSEFLLKLGNSPSFVRYFADPVSRILFSTQPHQFQAVENLVAQGLSYSEAVTEVAKAEYPKEMALLTKTTDSYQTKKEGESGWS